MPLVQRSDVVMHTAARVGEDGQRAAFEHDNVHGTESVCVVMEELGLRHLIHVSTVMVYGFDYPPDADEETPIRGQGNVYNDTKIAVERLVRENVETGTLDAVILRPSELYGPGCKAWVDRPLELLRNLQFALPDRGRGVLNPRANPRAGSTGRSPGGNIGVCRVFAREPPNPFQATQGTP